MSFNQFLPRLSGGISKRKRSGSKKISPYFPIPRIMLWRLWDCKVIRKKMGFRCLDLLESEAHSEPIQTSKMKLSETVNDLHPLFQSRAAFHIQPVIWFAIQIKYKMQYWDDVN